MNQRKSPALPAGAVPGLAPVSRTITQQQLDDYARASGDLNPLHLDPEFAAGTQFGGIIAHGMLTLAFIAEMMLAAFGRPWLESGSLKVRFKGAARVGDRVEAWGRVERRVQEPDCQLIVCSVGVRNQENGQEIISGTATLKA
jgi:3-hydroxybutyryl-CoA dehydratase